MIKQQTNPTRFADRRGFSVLEVIIAIAVLSLTVSMIGSMTGFTARSSFRDAMHADAAEAAHRLIIQYIEDESSLMRQAQRGLPVAVGARRFRFTVDKLVLSLDTDTVFDNEVGSMQATTRDAQSGFVSNLGDRLRLVRITIYALESEAGYAPGERILSLERTYDFLESENLIENIIQEFGETIDQQGTR